MKIRPQLVAVLCLLPALASASPKLWYRRPAAHWSEALPIGNGRLAAMVFGDPTREHLQLNEETIYAGKRMDRINPQASAAVPEIRRLLLSGKVVEAEKLAEQSMLAIPRRQPPYEPLGDLTLTFAKGSAPEKYRRALDLNNGVASVEYASSGTRFERQAFATYPDHAIVLHLQATGSGKLDFIVDLKRQADGKSSIESAFGSYSIVLRGQPVPPTSGRGYPGEPNTGVKFTSAVRVLTTGHVAAEGHASLHVTDASEVTLVFTAATDIRSANPDAACQQQLKAAASRSYSDLLTRHRNDFSNLASRVHLQLGASDGQIDTVPTDELLKSTVAGRDDQALTALYFAYGRYLLQSSSRQDSLPANLQGKWNDSLDPSWGSKYTININTEMNYWPAEVCNLPETADSLLQLFAFLRDNGRHTAAAMYGTNGIVAHHNTEVWGDTQPIDGIGSGIWPFGAAWLSLSLWDHYDYSRNLSYLREQAYPVMRDTAIFLLENLFDDGAGHLVSGPSLSPENRYMTPDGKAVSLDVSPTMDIELTHALFRRVRTAASLLKIDADLSARLAAAEARLLPLQVGRFGQLQEWRNDYPEKEPGHRHLSHLFAVYPSGEINPKTPKLWKAARVSLDRRLANGGGGTGWSRAWVVCLWATFREPAKARDSLHVLYEKSTWPNLFDLHPPHIFQIDGNLGATAGIAEMLLASNGSEITLLPALPAEWPAGSVTGLRARGNATLDLTWSNGRIKQARITSPTGGLWKMRTVNQPPKSISLQAHQTRTVSFP